MKTLRALPLAALAVATVHAASAPADPRPRQDAQGNPLR